MVRVCWYCIVVLICGYSGGLAKVATCMQRLASHVSRNTGLLLRDFLFSYHKRDV